MAEAIGFAASIVTLGEIAVRLSRIICSLKNAPDELLALANEVTELRLVFDEVSRAHGFITERAVNVQSSSSLSEILNRTNSKVNRLQRFLTDTGLGTKDSARRWKWIMKKRRAREIVAEVREARHDLATVLAAHNVINIERLDMAVTALSTTCNEKSASTSEANVNSFQETKMSPSDTVLSPEPTLMAPDQWVKNGSYPKAVGKDVGDDETETIAVSIRRCNKWCGCTCHLRYRAKTPSFFGSVFGSVLFGYTGNATQGRRCSVSGCAGQDDSSPFTVEFQYFFPSWLFTKAIFARFSSALAEPTLCLSVRNVIPLNSRLFIATQRGFLDELKMLFSRSLARPNDIGGLHGDTALHDAITSGKLDSCRILLMARADPCIENQNHVSAADHAWTRILSNEGSPEFLRELGNIFTFNDHLDDWKFSALHKIVLGLKPNNLEEQLDLSIADINTPDCHGRTPLWWTVRRNDVASTSTLLKFGADPHIIDNEGFCAMHNAAVLGKPSITETLLSFGGSPASWNHLQGYPVRTAVRYHDDPRLIEPFINLDVDLNDNTVGSGTTALHRAAADGRAAAIACLLDKGADTETPCKVGEPPYIRCIGGNHVAALRIFLNRGANYLMKMSGGETILHAAAKCADSTGVLNLLQEDGLSGVDINAKNRNGKTAMDILEESSHSADVKVAFANFIENLSSANQIKELGSIKSTKAELEVSSEQEKGFEDMADDSEYFEDAVEQHE